MTDKKTRKIKIDKRHVDRPISGDIRVHGGGHLQTPLFCTMDSFRRMRSDRIGKQIGLAQIAFQERICNERASKGEAVQDPLYR